MAEKGSGAAWGSLVAGVASCAALPAAIYVYALLGQLRAPARGLRDSGRCRSRDRRPVARAPGSRSPAGQSERWRRSGLATAGRVLGVIGLCMAASALVALGVYGLLEYVGLARVARGRDRFDPTAPDFLADPYPVLAALREATPVLRHEELDRWFVTRHADVRACLRDRRLGRNYRHVGTDAEFRAEPLDPRWQAFWDVERWSLLWLEPPDHTRIRKLVASAFTPRSVEAMREPAARFARELLEPLLERGADGSPLRLRAAVLDRPHLRLARRASRRPSRPPRLVARDGEDVRARHDPGAGGRGRGGRGRVPRLQRSS